MCGRFVQHADPEIYASRYAAELPADGLGDWRPSFNVAPTRPVLAIRAAKDGGRELAALRWGLIPSWSQGPDNRYSMINARAESVATKPAYRSAFKRRRCLIPADGFYEWQAPVAGEDAGKGGGKGVGKDRSKPKQPYFIHRRDGAPILLAGLWEVWRPQEGDPVHSCTIVVTDANAAIAPVHERMPVVLDPDTPGAMDTWLDPDNADTDALQALLRPAPAGAWVLDPVSRRVNSPRNDDADLLTPITDGG
ncbi:SOS response-associated peptidase [uncultured Thiohalocapsa sp.]|uniref:SOS response-associated peptidase n=1 Tax=uncultured Thiohalocapsa sp. TaxID=768990 RepID=UPI0025E4978A|nr:SOS response-associated peptidase [uncultured Thiohalocapsa sp.]